MRRVKESEKWMGPIDLLVLVESILKSKDRGFPCSSMVKNSPANARNMGFIPDLRGSHMPRSN